MCVFWFPCLAVPDSWMILVRLQSPFLPAPQRGEAPPTSRISSRPLPFAAYSSLSISVREAGPCFPVSLLLWDKMGDLRDTKLASFQFGPMLSYKIPGIGQTNRGSICGLLNFSMSFFTQIYSSKMDPEISGNSYVGFVSYMHYLCIVIQNSTDIYKISPGSQRII